MPQLMNCAHRADGHCLDCVVAEFHRREEELTRIAALLKDPTAVLVNILRGSLVLPPGYGPTAALRAFKTYVHQRLDAIGVPADPEPEVNAKHGCRIEGRLNWLLNLLGPSVSLAAQLKTLADLRAELAASRRIGKLAEEALAQRDLDLAEARAALTDLLAVSRDVWQAIIEHSIDHNGPPVLAGRADVALAFIAAGDKAAKALK